MTKEAVAEKYKEICESGKLNQGTFIPPRENKKKKRKHVFIPVVLSLMIITIATTMVVALDVGGVYTKFFAPKTSEDAESAKQEQLRETPLYQLGGTVLASLDDMEQQTDEIETMNQTLELQQSNMTELVKIYNEMSPIAAADVMNSLDTDTAVSILKNMDSEKIASILSLMKSDDAAKITQRLYPQ